MPHSPFVSAAFRSCLVLALLSCGWMVVGGSADVQAQDEGGPCADTLAAAETAYRNRNYQEAVTVASECTDPEAVGEDAAIRAYRVITLASLRQGALVQARSAVTNILQIDPTYTADPVNDPPSYDLFVSMVRKETDIAGVEEPEAGDTTEAEAPEEGDQPDPTQAEDAEPEPSASTPDRTVASFFIKPVGIGASDYTGDYPAQNVGHPFDLQEFTRGSGVPVLFTFELGYQPTAHWAIVLAFQTGNYPIVGYGGSNNTTDSYRYTPQLLGRYTFRSVDKTVRPYVDVGGNITFGGESLMGVGYGPSFGGGVSISFSSTVAMYVESRFNLTFPDDAIDGFASDGGGIDGSILNPVDSVNQLLGVGLRIDFGL